MAPCGSDRPAPPSPAASRRAHGGSDGASASAQACCPPTKRQRIQHLIQRGTRMANEQEGQQRERQPPAKRMTDTAAPCKARTSSRRTSWTGAEDAKLYDLVQQHGRSSWSVVAAQLPGRDRKRCRERFVNHLEPTLAPRAWSAEEDATMRHLQRTVGCQWTQLARNMTGRSPEDVKNRWLVLASRTGVDRVELDGKSRRKPPQQWSTAEKEKLRSLVFTHGARNWLFIASQLPGRTDLQCLQHWHRVLDDAVIKGKGSWTSNEDKMLRAKVAELGRKWTEVATFLPGRIGKQCRERFLNHVDPELIKTPWTTEEEEVLIRAHAKRSTQWSAIAAELPGRSESAIKNHWRKLQRRQMQGEQGETSTPKA